MSEPPHLDHRRIRPAQRRRLLLVMAAGVGLSMAGGLGIALTETDRLGRTLGVVVLFAAVTMVAPLVALWRSTRTDRR